MLDDRLTEMIDPEGCEKLEEWKLVNDTGPHFRSPKNMRKLAMRIAHAGMPRRNCHGGVYLVTDEAGLFCVIEKANLDDEDKMVLETRSATAVGSKVIVRLAVVDRTYGILALVFLGNQGTPRAISTTSTWLSPTRSAP